MNRIQEKELVDKILHGDEKALNEFYQNNKNKLFSYIKKKISNEKDVEELTADTFLSAIDNLDHFLGKCSLFSFLCSIANHKVVDFYRKQKIKCLFFSQNPILENIISKISVPEEELEKLFLKKKIKKVLFGLLPQHRKILIEKYVKGLRVKEIARTSKMTLKQTESLLFRARRVFKNQFALVEQYG